MSRKLLALRMTLYVLICLEEVSHPSQSCHIEILI